MNDLLQKKRFAETAEYLLGLTEKVSTDTIFCDTGNTVIDSIVNYSFRNASAQGINVKVLAKIPEKIEMNVADIVTILSNLFDNAITATLKLSENRMIEVKISYSKCRLFIFVQNTYNGIVKYQNGKIITTKEKEEGKFVRRERYVGSCSRSFYVGNEVKSEDIKASFKFTTPVYKAIPN